MSRGYAFIYSNAAPQVPNDFNFQYLGTEAWFGWPISIHILVAVFALGAFVLARSVYGRSIVATGGNTEAARLSGIPVDPLRGSTYVMTSLYSGIGGMILSSRLGVGQADMSGSIALDSIAIVVVGDTSLPGSEGTVWRTAIGLLIIVTLTSVFDSLATYNNYQLVAKGVIVIGAVALDIFARRMRTRRTFDTPQERSMIDKDVGVALTFDYDAMSLWIGSFGAKSPSMTSRGEFGVIGVRRILSTLDHYKIAGTFYIPGHTAYAFPKSVQDIAAAGHEIGHHGWIHENPATVTPERERWILEKGFKALDEVAGVRPVGYRSPAWDNSPESIPLLLEYGFEYESSQMGTDFEPYWCRVGDSFTMDDPYVFGTPVNLVELPVAWHLDDFPQFEYVVSKGGIIQGVQTPRSMLQIWKDEFDYLYERVGKGLFSITMHPQVIGRAHRLLLLEGIIEHVKDKPGVSFTTMRDYNRKWREGKTPSLPAEVAQG